jgi:hypothetical protein
VVQAVYRDGGRAVCLILDEDDKRVRAISQNLIVEPTWKVGQVIEGEKLYGRFECEYHIEGISIKKDKDGNLRYNYQTAIKLVEPMLKAEVDNVRSPARSGKFQ